MYFKTLFRHVYEFYENMPISLYNKNNKIKFLFNDFCPFLNLIAQYNNIWYYFSTAILHFLQTTIYNKK